MAEKFWRDVNVTFTLHDTHLSLSEVRDIIKNAFSEVKGEVDMLTVGAQGKFLSCRKKRRVSRPCKGECE